MNAISTYDVVEMVVEEATKQFGDTWFISDVQKKKLETNCTRIDRLISEFDCESVEAEVDDETMVLRISLVCFDMILEHGRKHPFFTIIQDTASFSFSAAGDSIKVDFEFAGLWEHKD